MNSDQTDVAGIESKIFFVRGERVMLDRDLAELYQVPTKRLKEQVKRNLKRFPADFMFVLSNQEFTNLRSQIATSSLTWGGHRFPPFAFTEQGIAMLSSVLNSERAIAVNITIMRAFVQMRRVRISDREFEFRIKELAAKYNLHDQKFRVVFDVLRILTSPQPLLGKKIKGLSCQGE